MSNSGSLPPAAWYPDPDGAPRQRYWDGAQWTAHYHPPMVATPAAIPGTPTPRRSRKGLVIGLLAGATAVVLAITAIVVVPLVVNGPAGGGLYTDRSDVYDFTNPILDIEPDREFDFRADYDLNALAEAHAAEIGSDYAATDFAFEIYFDAALTLRTNALVIQYEPGENVYIKGRDDTFGYGTESYDAVDIMAEGSEWGLHDDYYLVRKLDESGEVLAKPIVTRFTVKRELEPPVVTLSTPNNDGNLTVSWQPVDGATSYFVITSKGEDDFASRYYTILGEVSGTEWSSASAVFEADVAPFALTQNENMELYDGSSSDSLEGGIVYENDATGFDFGVIATDGTRFSPYTSQSSSAASALPYERAFFASRNLKQWGPSGYIEGFENVQKVFAFTSLDGATRSTVGYIVESEVRERGDLWSIPVRGRGTMLGEWVPVLKSTVPDLHAAIEKYNADAQAAAPTTGMAAFDVISAPVDEFADGIAEPPATDYPIYGSTEFTRMLGAHMIAQTPVVDISAFVNEPGAPDALDAALEALYQNPYAINVEGISLSADGGRMFLTYANSLTEAQQIQADISAAVDEVISSVVSDGMSDAQKVTVLNDWLVGNAEYNDAALVARDTNVWDGLPDGFENAWHAGGVLVDGTGVCASYAYAFTALANAAGVTTVTVQGDVLNGGAHAWNKVFVDGQWLAVDPTWNDSWQGNAYLMIPDSGFTDAATRTQGTSWMIDWSIAEYATP